MRDKTKAKSKEYKFGRFGGITLISFAISRKCVRYEERAWKPCERREKERKV